MTDRSAANGTTAAPGRKQPTAQAAFVATILSSVARPRARTWPRKPRQGASLYGPRTQSSDGLITDVYFNIFVPNVENGDDAQPYQAARTTQSTQGCAHSAGHTTRT